MQWEGRDPVNLPSLNARRSIESCRSQRGDSRDGVLKVFLLFAAVLVAVLAIGVACAVARN
jgi:hypothetical protein